MRTVRNHPETNKVIPEEFLTRIETIMENTFLYQKKMVVPKEPLAIVAHGDYLRNNLAFKYNKDKVGLYLTNLSQFVKNKFVCSQPDVPNAAMMFDFQTLRYTSPMVDLTTFMANSTGIDVRGKHFQLIFDTYYNSLVMKFCENAKMAKECLPEFLRYSKVESIIL